jgi:arginyl-tRNA synthetase
MFVSPASRDCFIYMVVLSQIIKQRLQKAFGIKDLDFSVSVPERQEFGDYSTNLAFVLAQQKQTSPFLVAEDLRKEIESRKFLQPYCDKVEVKNGYLNFWLERKFLSLVLKDVLRKKGSFGRISPGKTRLVIVEYSSPNIAKPFTVAHLRSTIIGDSIANLLEFAGWKVMRDNHLGDWGTQFGKQIYAIKTWGKKRGGAYSIRELVDLYVRFHQEAENNPSLENEARAWFKKLEDGNLEARSIWKKCVDRSLAEFNRIYSCLGVKFSKEFEKGRGLGESFFEDKMPAVIAELERKNMLQTGENGAKLVFFEAGKYPPAMILKKDGATLYHTRDLAADAYRLRKYHPALIVNEVGAEQSLYFQQLFEMEKMLGWYKDGQRLHIKHGLYQFKEGKMSTRKGHVVWLEDVLKEAVRRARKLGCSNSKVAEIVAIGALKYNDLKRDHQNDIVFDWDEILNMKGNSGPYLQYSFARCRSIIGKAKGLKRVGRGLELASGRELLLLRLSARFTEVVALGALAYAPHIICTYLYELAQKFNEFYEDHRIIEYDENGNYFVDSLRLGLVGAVSIILANGLKLLGIKVIDKM